MPTWKKGKAYRLNNKRLVMEHYGDGCACCGEKELIFLVIDHINGGGTKHKKSISRIGGNFYTWLRLNNFPEGFQVLCQNCNWAKRMGECPHKLSGSEAATIRYPNPVEGTLEVPKEQEHFCT